MKNEDTSVLIIDNVLTEAVHKGTLHLYATDTHLQGAEITINNQKLLNFGSCCYLGLEHDPRIKEGTIDAVRRYGSQFSASRAYVSAPLYLELESLLQEMFGAFPLISASTTLGHLSALPVLIGPKDAIILDLQVHASVQLAANQCRLKGTACEIIRHSDMNALEKAIQSFRQQGVRNIWYLADGVYSMYGDIAPLGDIDTLLAKYENFYLYIDDAHGVSWNGERGKGTVLASRPIHPKMIVALSLNKSFAAAGGVILFPNAEWLRKVRTCGGTMIFCGPIQPPMLGAAIASAKIHLSSEINQLQQELREKILYCNQMMQEYNLPLLSKDLTPIRFIGLGTLKIVCSLAKRVMDDGYYANISTFPAVSMKRGGLRVVINNLLTKENIKGICQSIHHHLPRILAEENYELDFNKTFGSSIPRPLSIMSFPVKKEQEFKISHETTIMNINKGEWNRRLGDRGPFTWEGLLFFEEFFSNQPLKENNWEFNYFVIRDSKDEIVLKTFFTIVISKDDIFSPASVSEQIEQQRMQKGDPYHFTSKVLMMGCLLSEGNHLYLDYEKNWQGALQLLMKQLTYLQEQHQCETILFRDLPGSDKEMQRFMMNQEYIKVPLPETHIYENVYRDFMGTLASLPGDKRYFLRKEVLSKEDQFEVEILTKETRQPTEQEFKDFYQLYMNVKSKGLEINVFNLPENIFEAMLKTDIWELIILYFRDQDTKIPVAIGACMKGEETYCPIVIGLDYNYVKSQGIYHQHLYRTIQRGIALNAKRIFIGMTASLQKRRFGANPHEIVAYIQSTDTYKMEVLSRMSVHTKS